MNSKARREFVSQAIIIVAVCAGGWMMLVKPKVDELGKIEQTIAQNAADEKSMNQQTLDDAVHRMSAIRDRVAQVKSYNALAGDSSKFYGLVMNLAEANGVRIDSLQPSASHATSAEGQAVSTHIDLSFQGDYQNAAVFLEQLNELEAFIRPLQMQLTPTIVNGHPLVNGTFSCDVMSFAIADALAGLGDTKHAQP